jgi:hypothetical protein
VEILILNIDFNVPGMSYEKLFDKILKLKILKYYVIFYFDFFTKLRQLRRQRHLLENKQISCNILRFLTWIVLAAVQAIQKWVCAKKHSYLVPSKVISIDH